ncbi:MAG: hypothetical protein IJJ41_04375 [Clostridia bacterium]|nr:hypothetical protein [Clostridia bacterium]
MRKKVWLIIAIVFMAGLLIAGGIWMFHFFKNTAGGDKPEKIGEITALETLSLRESGMRITQVYEILEKGETAEISLYTIYYKNGEDERHLESRVNCPQAALLEQLNACKVGSWNGFHGAHPKNVMDGTMFTLEATVNGGTRLYADGSQNFPKHYHEFVSWLSEQLSGHEVDTQEP